jgi:tartrate dehydrogenase/decarboxylase/D-malate dehydrogenase
MRRHRVAAIPADGIGQEVIPAGLEVLRALSERGGDFALDVTEFPWGSDFYRRTGRMMPDDGLETLRGFDAIFFGAVGDRELPDDVTLWGLRLRICQGFDQYANIRPTRVLPGITSPLRAVARVTSTG